MSGGSLPVFFDRMQLYVTARMAVELAKVGGHPFIYIYIAFSICVLILVSMNLFVFI